MPKQEQAPPRSVRLYPPIESKWEAIKHGNFNYFVNLLFAEKLGIPPDVVESYRRNEKEEQP